MRAVLCVVAFFVIVPPLIWLGASMSDAGPPLPGQATYAPISSPTAAAPR